MDKNNTSRDNPLKYSKYLSAYLSQTKLVDQGVTVASFCDLSKENESPTYSSSKLVNSLMLSSRNWDIKKLISKVDNIAQTLDENLITVRRKSLTEDINESKSNEEEDDDKRNVKQGSKELLQSLMDELKHLRETVSQYSQLDESIKRTIEKTQSSLKSEITQELWNQITAQLSEFRQDFSKLIDDNTRLQESKDQVTFQSVAESNSWNLGEIRNELYAHRQMLDTIIEQNKIIFQLHERYLLEFQNREIFKEMNNINSSSNNVFKGPMIDNEVKQEFIHEEQHYHQLEPLDTHINNFDHHHPQHLFSNLSPSYTNRMTMNFNLSQSQIHQSHFSKMNCRLPPPSTILIQNQHKCRNLTRASEIITSDSDITMNTNATTSLPRIQKKQPSNNNITNTGIPEETVSSITSTRSNNKAAQLMQTVYAAFNLKHASPIFVQLKQHLGLEDVSKDKDKEDKNIVDNKHINQDPESTSNDSIESSKGNGLNMLVHPHYRPPRLPIVLCHGLFGFDKLGPTSLPQLQIHYWGGVQEALQKIGAQVVVTKVPRTGGIRTRAQELHRILETNLAGTDVNLLAHSMGGLDCRYLIAHLPTEKCTVRSLTTVATPHRGSPFMDWCRDNFGVGVVPNSFSTTVKAVDETINRLSENASRKSQRGDTSSSNDKEAPIFSKFRKLANNSGNKDPSSSDNRISSSSSSSDNKKLLPLSIHIPNINIHIPNIPIPNIHLPHISLPSISLPNLNVSLALSSTLSSTTAIINPLTRLLIQAVDTPAYSNLTTDYCTNHFNPNTPNHPSVAYYSYGASTDIPIWSPLYFPHQIIKAKEGPNDGLVSVKSAQWGRYIRTVDCDHWDLTDRWRIKIGGASKFDPVEFYLHVATFLAKEGY
ncbi:14620_t:CDS:10 [Ambispora leptoticha]|uniref:14620_t:CDS:1 n=1 Tax=Ambispora leptoticha TaxID=144679 RepID=A0A9N8ZXG5_9GLOM|nr:14620_t:CDS:10 [Ambispora leptoticha]